MGDEQPIKSGLTVAQQGMLLVLLPLLVSLFAIVCLEGLLRQSEAEYDKQDHARALLINMHADVASIFTCIHEIAEPMSDEKPLDANEYQSLRGRLDKIRKSILKRARLNPSLKPVSEKAAACLDSVRDLTIKMEDVFGPNSTVPYEKGWRFVREDMIKMSTKAVVVHNELLELQPTFVSATYSKRQEQLDSAIIYFLGGTITGFVAMAFVLGRFFSRNIVERLQAINSNAESIAVGKPLAPVLSGSDELALLDAELHDAALLLEEARRRELAVLDLSADVIFSIDRRGRFESVGLPVINIWKYTPDELLRRPVTDIVSPPFREMFRDVIERTFGNRETQRVETVIVGKNGNLFDCMVSIQPDANSETLVCVALDNTERKRVERMKQRFVSIVSHDLRTPLASVSSSLSLLSIGARGELDEPAQQRIQKCEDNVSRLMSLIQDLLDIERLESGKFPLTLSCVSAYDVFETAIESVRFFATARGVSIRQDYGDASILADERRLVQVIVNLLANSLKFSPDSGEVTVSLQVMPNNLARLSIKDQGPGIGPEDRERIFNRFEQSASGTNTKQKGTGLGLAIAKAIVEAHGGEIGVESEAGQGSCFFVLVPLYEMDDEEESDEST